MLNAHELPYINFKIGQPLTVRQQDNLPTGGNFKRKRKLGYTTGTVIATYPFHVVLDMGNYKSSIQKVDLLLDIQEDEE